jgi:hypothetical protein
MRNWKKKKRCENGQALITLLVFSIMSITVTSASVILIFANSRSGTRQQQGEIAYEIAQSGAENGVLRLLRNPNYTGETSLPIGSGIADIVVSGSGSVANPYILISTGKIGNLWRKIEIRATYQNNLLAITSRKEIYQ